MDYPLNWIWCGIGIIAIRHLGITYTSCKFSFQGFSKIQDIVLKRKEKIKRKKKVKKRKERKKLKRKDKKKGKKTKERKKKVKKEKIK